jgi:hypothetical protein
MRAQLRVVSFLLVSFLVFAHITGAVAQQSALHVFLRNRAVVGYQVGSEVFVDPQELSKLLTPGELKRVSCEPTSHEEARWWDVRVDGQTLAVTGPGVPIVAVAQAMGFTKRLSNGMLDLVPPVNDKDGPADGGDYTRRSEYRIAAQRLEQVLKVLPPSNDVVGQKRVQRIGDQVALASPLANMKWTFVLVKSNAPNAACIGEGHVFVTTALLAMGVTDDELAGVLGHEIAHGVRRHPFRRVDLIRDIRQLLTDHDRLQKQVNEESRSSHYDVNLRNQVESYERRRADLQYRFDHEIFYSQIDEEEADVLGMRYAVSAGYSADGLGRCLAKLEKATIEQFGTGVLNDDMSHPPTVRRLEILQKARENAKF